MTHPRDALLGAAVAQPLPVCDHYCGTAPRMARALALQAAMTQEFGACVFDVTLDCEDGAPVGAEEQHAWTVLAIVQKERDTIKSTCFRQRRRVAVRVHPVDHPAFERDVAILLAGAGDCWSHVMLPKVSGVADVERAVQAIDAALGASAQQGRLPVHVLVESPAAVQQAAALAAHPRVESLSFGLMDFVSAHGGAIPASAMTLATPGGGDTRLDQFGHPLVLRAKLDISAACHAAGKVPAHCVVTEFRQPELVRAAAQRAARELGYTRMWSIHPDQIRPILAAFAPEPGEVEQSSHIICQAHAQDWAPTSVAGRLHDRASYRYHWQVLERAHQTGRLPLQDPAAVFFADRSPPQ